MSRRHIAFFVIFIFGSLYTTKTRKNENENTTLKSQSLHIPTKSNQHTLIVGLYVYVFN